VHPEGAFGDQNWPKAEAMRPDPVAGFEEHLSPLAAKLDGG
jgi:hypothetical protein